MTEFEAEYDHLEGDGTIAFADVTFNLFSVLLILLLIVPIGVMSSAAEAPTLNRQETPFLSVRDCYVETLRPTSQFLLFTRHGLEVIDYDGIALTYLAGDGPQRFNFEEWRANVSTFPDAEDANVFRMSVVIRNEGAPNIPQPDLAAMIRFLDETIYGQGYVPYFEVFRQDIPNFAPLFSKLLADGRRFRWRIVGNGGAFDRIRSARGFESEDFCR